MRIEPAPSNITRLSVLLAALIWTNGGLGQTHVNSAPGKETLRTVTFRVKVPEGVGAVYMAGNRPEIGNWQPNGLALSGEGTDRTASLRLPAGTDLEYKFTLGSWEREALGPTGTIPQNHRLLVDSDQEITIEIRAFRKQLSDYLDDWKGGGILGRLEYWRDVSSKHLTATRHVGIWLPPGYDDNPAQRYHVLYMHDGQNLFDPRIASTGVDWGVDEAVVRNVEAGRMPPLIVVSVWCTSQRAREYSPWDLGTNYAKFLIEELMPRVDGKFRTLTGPEHTAVMGSSMGGCLFRFGFAGGTPD